MKIGTYGKVNALGHAMVKGILDGPVRVEEKIDGSQFSFGVIDPPNLTIRSKRMLIHADEPPAMFKPSVDTVLELYREGRLKEGWTYRGEAMSKPKHNILCYERAPDRNIVLYDVDTALHDYMSHADMTKEAEYLGLESVPLLYEGMVTDLNFIKDLIDKTESILGGKMEGVVLKRIANDMFHPDGKAVRAKYVSEAFKEKHTSSSMAVGRSKDIVMDIGNSFSVPARWRKIVQGFAEDGLITHTPADIGPMIKRLQEDVMEECEDEIKELLFKHFYRKLRGSVVKGFPQWYKEQLAESEFSS